MSISVIPRDFLLQFESMKLGRFIASIQNPQLDYIDPLCSYEPQVSVVVGKQVGASQQVGSRTGFELGLTAFISSRLSKRAEARIQVSTDTVKTYTLCNMRQWFSDALRQKDTQKWVERVIDQGDNICLVTGFHTITDARIGQMSATGSGMSGKLTAPVGMSLAAIGAIIPFGDIIHPALAGGHSASEGNQTVFLAPGEQICALQYLRVRHRWISSRREKTYLSSKTPSWKVYDRCRGGEVEDNDMIEVDLAADEDLEEHWEREALEDGEVLLWCADDDEDEEF